MYWVLTPGNNICVLLVQFAHVWYSLWLVQCSAVFRYSHHNARENPEMRTLFYRLCHLLHLHLHVIFVFDGMDRAKTKRGKKVKKNPSLAGRSLH